MGKGRSVSGGSGGAHGAAMARRGDGIGRRWARRTATARSCPITPAGCAERRGVRCRFGAGRWWWHGLPIAPSPARVRCHDGGGRADGDREAGGASPTSSTRSWSSGAASSHISSGSSVASARASAGGAVGRRRWRRIEVSTLGSEMRARTAMAEVQRGQRRASMWNTRQSSWARGASVDGGAWWWRVGAPQAARSE